MAAQQEMDVVDENRANLWRPGSELSCAPECDAVVRHFSASLQQSKVGHDSNF